MRAAGFSLNLLILLAMQLAGVEDAIVVVENIHRFIEEGLYPIKAAQLGTCELIGPVIAITITLTVVYTSIGLMEGLTGVLFKTLGGGWEQDCTPQIESTLSLTG